MSYFETPKKQESCSQINKEQNKEKIIPKSRSDSKDKILQCEDELLKYINFLNFERQKKILEDYKESEQNIQNFNNLKHFKEKSDVCILNFS